MFTLKFYLHNSDSHEVFSCERYSVSEERREPDLNEEPLAAPLKLVVRMFRSLDDDNPYYETVGDREHYAHAFVVNEGGKTIDTLRAPDDVPLMLRVEEGSAAAIASG
ncbi:MAG: hypothetical protein V3S54_01980 [Woeseiaceae bacterium]